MSGNWYDIIKKAIFKGDIVLDEKDIYEVIAVLGDMGIYVRSLSTEMTQILKYCYKLLDDRLYRMYSAVNSVYMDNFGQDIEPFDLVVCDSNIGLVIGVMTGERELFIGQSIVKIVNVIYKISTRDGLAWEYYTKLQDMYVDYVDKYLKSSVNNDIII